MTDTAQTYEFSESWTVTKPTVRTSRGLVSSQHRLASEVGAKVLSAGGNAVDAAVSAGLAIGTVEPWMSGLGGGGFMVIYNAREDRAQAVEFGMRASRDLDPADYPLESSGQDADLFSWPAVVGDRNVRGPLSVAVPGFVRGHALALERFGTLSWQAAIEPAVELARQGMAVDWYATLKIASEARTIAQDAESARTYLPGGFPPAGAWGGPVPRIHLGRLADTYERLHAAGPEDFYEGEIAASIVEDSRRLGIRMRLDDLADCVARVTAVEPVHYGTARVFAAPGLSAGPTLVDALARLSGRCPSPPGVTEAVSSEMYRAYASSLHEAYAHRLATLGDVNEPDHAPGCTTHLSVVDAEGNCVALTQTLLSVFGSKVMLPGTGILMNNGVMWFDPRPGQPNSMAPGKRPLSNMCPTVVRRDDGLTAALGASGGRRIMPAVFQLISFLVDHGMDIEHAIHTPRIDASGAGVTLADRRLDDATLEALSGDTPTLAVQNGVYPVLFACPNVAARNQTNGQSEGGAFVMSPWSSVAAG